ncbi:MAG TPA: DUF1080 domain-containing protein [Polyangiaceae bacterium]
MVASVLSCKSKPTSPAWRPLFDGKTTDGWAMAGPGSFSVENGELVTHGGMGLLWYTREPFGHCQIRVVFMLTSDADNSGVFIRIREPPQTAWDGVHHGYEVQIDNHGDAWHRTGVLYSLTEAQSNVSPQPGSWSTMLVTLDGPRTIVDIDGHRVTDFREGDPVPPRTETWEPERGPRPDVGFIGLQNHGGAVRVHFKDVSIRAL